MGISFYQAYDDLLVGRKHPVGFRKAPAQELEDKLNQGTADLTPAAACSQLAESWERDLKPLPSDPRGATKEALVFIDANADNIAQAIYEEKQEAHLNSRAPLLTVVGLSSNPHSVGINDYNNAVDKLLNYLVIKEYHRAHRDDENFDFDVFCETIRHTTTEVTTALQRLDPQITSLRSNAVENTLTYLKSLEDVAQQQQKQFEIEKQALQQRIGYPSVRTQPDEEPPSQAASGYIAECEKQIKIIETRQKKIDAVTLPDINRQISNHAKQMPQVAGEVVSEQDSVAFVNALYDEEISKLRVDAANAKEILDMHRDNGTAKEPDEPMKKRIQAWQAKASVLDGYQKWHQQHQLLMRTRVARQKEKQALLSQKQKIEALQTSLSAKKDALEKLKNPTKLSQFKEDVESTFADIDVKTQPGSAAKEAAEIVKAVSGKDDDFGLPMLGKDLQQFDYELFTAITAVNTNLATIKDLAQALEANPDSEHLQEEYHRQREQLKINLDRLLKQLNEYHINSSTLVARMRGINQDLTYLLQQRENYKEFLERLENLVKVVKNPWRGTGVPLEAINDEAFKEATNEKSVFVYGQNGRLEVYTNPESGKPIKLSQAAFNQAIQKWKAAGGTVTIRSPFIACLGRLANANTIYQFTSPSAKQAFLTFAMQEAMKEEKEKRKDRDEPDDAAHVHAQPGDHTNGAKNTPSPSRLSL